MDMLQIYLVFSLKTIVHVQYFNNNGHLVKTCPFYPGIGFRIKYQSRQKFEIWDHSFKIIRADNQANKNYLASHSGNINKDYCKIMIYSGLFLCSGIIGR